MTKEDKKLIKEILTSFGAVGVVWLCWTYQNIGRDYFDFLPEKWQSIAYFKLIGIWIVVRFVIKTFTLTIAIKHRDCGVDSER